MLKLIRIKIYTLCDGKFPNKAIKTVIDYFNDDEDGVDYKNCTFIRPAVRFADNTDTIQMYYCDNKNEFNNYFEFIENITADDFSLKYWKEKKWGANV